MKKLLTSPSNMALGEQENQIYHAILKQSTEISLNLMAVKIEQYPDDFLGWCYELLDVAKNRINFDLLDPHQLPILKKLQDLLISAISFLQLKTLRVTPWPIASNFIEQRSDILALSEQLKLINYISEIRATELQNMIAEDRLVFSGKHSAILDPSVYQFDAEWFASTKSAKVFHQLLADMPNVFDKALAHIPLTGDVSQAHYQDFVIDYLLAFNNINEKPTLAPATRLLSMRRPDVFTPVTSSKLEQLCLALGITKLTNRDFERYWQDIVLAIHAMPWFKMPTCSNELEQQLFSIKALIPCFFYYADEATANNSNYLKLLNKPKRTSKSSPSKKRGKESAVVLVDRALSDGSLPEHIIAKRDSIIAEVEKGRSVYDTITLMRTIFG